MSRLTMFKPYCRKREISLKSINFAYLEIKKLPFFSVLEWSNIDGYPAPFVPNPDDDMDTFYFEGEYITLSFIQSLIFELFVNRNFFDINIF